MRTIGRPGKKKHMYPVFAQSYQGALSGGAFAQSSVGRQYAHRAPIYAALHSSLPELSSGRQQIPIRVGGCPGAERTSSCLFCHALTQIFI